MDSDWKTVAITDWEAIAKRLENDWEAIAKRLENDWKAIAKRLEKDRKTIIAKGKSLRIHHEITA
jgi:hypothetical protein